MKALIIDNYNYIILTAGVSWAIAQILKALINFLKSKTFDPERLIGPGGMPSSHSAFVASASTAVWRIHGSKSTQFAISFVFAVVVMYDAMSIRLQSGYHAKEINNINLQNNNKGRKKLKELLGHTPIQVFCGALLGILIAFLVPMKI